MKSIFIAISIIFCFVSIACAAQKTIDVEYQYPDLAEIHHANVYQEGVKVCSSLDNNPVFSCSSQLKLGMRNFTLTVETEDGLESPHSEAVAALVVPGKPIILKFGIK